jgi:hypothetical protein
VIEQYQDKTKLLLNINIILFMQSKFITITLFYKNNAIFVIFHRSVSVNHTIQSHKHNFYRNLSDCDVMHVSQY